MTLLHRLSALAVPLLLVVLTAIAGYAFSRISDLSLPVPLALAAFTVLLPLTSYFTTVLALPHLRNFSPLSVGFLTPFAVQIIYETAIIVLSLTYMVPSASLNCGLEDRWGNAYRSKNGRAIKAIQDAFDCCGFNSIRDRAWPFVGNAKTEKGCVEIFGRSKSCIDGWKKEQQLDAGLLLLVAAVVFIVKILNVVFFLTNSSWAPKWTRHLKWHGQSDRSSLDDNRASMRRLIEQSSSAATGEYHDDPETGVRSSPPPSGEEEYRPRVEPSQLAETDNEWRSE